MEKADECAECKLVATSFFFGFAPPGYLDNFNGNFVLFYDNAGNGLVD